MSDQDFFFDEDEAPKAETSEKTTTGNKATTAKSRTATTKASTAAPTQSVSMTVAALIGVIALLLGVIIGIFLPIGTAGNIPAPGPGATVPPNGMGGGGGSAPQLSPDQLDQDLPPGHPPIGGETPGGPDGGAEGSEETTPSN